MQTSLSLKKFVVPLPRFSQSLARSLGVSLLEWLVNIAKCD